MKNMSTLVALVALSFVGCLPIRTERCLNGPWKDAPSFGRVPKAYEVDDPELVRDGVKAVFLDGVACHGKPTRFFAYYGVPENSNGLVPGMVLIHGGGGSAVADWVKMWNARGYAAISMDVCGCQPTVGGKSQGASRHNMNWDRHAWSGPSGWDASFEQIDEPVADQWTYHAVAAAILSRKFLGSQPNVNAGRIGVTGISWGGYLTSIVGAVDPFFAFAAPVYGCGCLAEHSLWSEKLAKMGEKGRAWSALWDPSVYLPSATCPYLWVDSTGDQFYPLDSVRKSALLTKGPRYSTVIKDLVHGHVEGEAPAEIVAFADWMLKGGVPPVAFSDVSTAGGVIGVDFKADRRKIVRAEFVWTTDTSAKWNERRWKSRPVEGFNPDSGHVETYYPSDASCYFINLIDDNGLVFSSDWVLPLTGDLEEKIAWAAARTVPREHVAPTGEKLPYRWHEPAKLVKGEKYPLVVFLHGAGERGSENVRQMIHGVPQILNYSERKNKPCFLIAGQVSGEACPYDKDGFKWAQVPWDGETQPITEKPSVAMTALIDLIDGLLRENSFIDASRVYVTGLSMGGYGTWDLVMRRSSWFAAAMPLCGGADDMNMSVVKEVPFWVFHGGADTTVPTVRGRAAYEALKAAGGNVQYREYPGVSHDCWTPTYSDDSVLDWFFGQSKAGCH